MISAIDSDSDQDTAAVRFAFSSKVDVRTFREENSYIVDVSPALAKAERPDETLRSDELAGLAAELAERDKAPLTAEAPKTIPVPATPPAAPAPMPPHRMHRQEGRLPHRSTLHPPLRSRLRVNWHRLHGSRVQSRRSSHRPRSHPSPSRAAAASGDGSGNVNLKLKRADDNVTLLFPFASATAGRGVPARRHALAGVRHHRPSSTSACSADDRQDHQQRRLTRARTTRQVVRLKLERPR